VDLEKVVSFCEKYASEFVEVILGTLLAPRLRFEPDRGQPTSPIIRLTAQETKSRELSVRLDAKLFSFVLLSLFIGYGLNNLAVKPTELIDFKDTALIVSVYWLLFAFLAGGVCKLLRGPGSFAQTVSVVLQVLAATCVAASAATLITTSLASGVSTKFHADIHRKAYTEGVILYFCFHAALFAVYFLWSMKILHRFRWPQMTALLALVCAGLVLKLALYAFGIVIENGLLIE
jgi:hypothetical protein